MNTPAVLPPCANWKVWKGREIEGFNGLGEMTLFVRDLSTYGSLIFLREQNLDIDRIWFCKEFRDREVILNAPDYFLECCIEMSIDEPEFLTPNEREFFKIFWKVNRQLQDGDTVCMGERFNEEFYKFGSSKGVVSGHYNSDIFIA